MTAIANALSGKDGKVMMGTGSSSSGTEVAHVRHWSANLNADNKPYTSSSTAGWAKLVTGNKSWKGSMNLYLESGDMDLGLLEEGSSLYVHLYTADSTSPLSGEVIVDSVSYESLAIEGADPTGAQVAFTGNGAPSTRP